MFSYAQEKKIIRTLLEKSPDAFLKGKKTKRKTAMGRAVAKTNVNEPYSDAVNLSQIDFVYHFEQMARTTERLPVVSLVKYMEKTICDSGKGVCVASQVFSTFDGGN